MMPTVNPDSPYVNAALAATRQQLPEPKLAVEPWLDRLVDMDEGVHDVGETEAAFDHLVTVAALRRVRPELLDPRERQRLKRWTADADSQMDRLLPQALSLPDMEGWVEEAMDMDAAWWDPTLAREEHAGWAERVLRDLDEADLLAAAARHHLRGRPGDGPWRQLETLEDGIEAAWAWFLDNLDAFETASLHIQAFGMALRPEVRQEPVLAESAEKLVLLLQELERTERQLAGNPADAALPLRPVPQTDEQDRPAPPWRLRDFLPERPALAAADARATDAEGVELTWRSPDGLFLARTVVPDAPGSSRQIEIRIWWAEGGGFATELAGTVAELGGCAVRVEAPATAGFALGTLDAERPPQLLICGQPWQLDLGR